MGWVVFDKFFEKHLLSMWHVIAAINLKIAIMYETSCHWYKF